MLNLFKVEVEWFTNKHPTFLYLECSVSLVPQENCVIWQNMEGYKDGKVVAEHEFRSLKCQEFSSRMGFSQRCTQYIISSVKLHWCCHIDMTIEWGCVSGVGGSDIEGGTGAIGNMKEARKTALTSKLMPSWQHCRNLLLLMV